MKIDDCAAVADMPSVWLESLLASELLVVDSEQQVYVSDGTLR